MGNSCHAILPNAGAGAHAWLSRTGARLPSCWGGIGPRPGPVDDGPEAVQAMKEGVTGVLKTFEALQKDRCAMVAEGAGECGEMA
jgi:hypothetical protein